MASIPRGLSRLKKLAKEIPDETEVLKLLSSLQERKDDHAADRAAAIVGGTLVEAALEAAILSKFVPLDPKEERGDLFDGDKNGPLATFSARIRLGYAVGLYGPLTKEELECIKAVRNAFAHGALTLDFKTPDVVAICNTLSLFEKSAPSEGYLGNTPREKYISTVAFISSRLRRNILQPRGSLELFALMTRWGDLS